MTQHDFCRVLLRLVMEDVRKHTTVRQRRRAWAHRVGLGRDGYEFHGPDNFYWHGRADCLWHARVNGWTRWLEIQGAINVINKARGVDTPLADEPGGDNLAERAYFGEL